MDILEIFNPIFWIFLSYSFGALITTWLQSTSIFPRFENHNYISDRLTKRLGVLQLGWLIRKSFMGKFNQKLQIKGGFNRERLERLKREMTLAENSHLIAFIAFQILTVLFFLWEIPLWQIVGYTISNVVFNLYLVFLQQYNKRRINRILSK